MSRSGLFYCAFTIFLFALSAQSGVSMANFPENPSQYKYLIYVNYGDRTLTLFTDQGVTVAKYPIVIPRVLPPKLPMEADVTSVDKDPHWRPTKNTREAYAKKFKTELPETVTPFKVNPLNAMGTRRLNLKFTLNPHLAEIKIHGTNAPELVKKRLKLSRGCIRMLNEDIEKLTDIIRGHKTKVIFGRGERKLASLFCGPCTYLPPTFQILS